jgi:hypothetical protein
LQLLKGSGVKMPEGMKEELHHDRDDGKEDPVWELLSKDAASRPIVCSPWFAAHTAGLAVGLTQSGRPPLGFQRILRWLLPLPLAGVAALLILTAQDALHLEKSCPFVSTEEEFERNMELLAQSD